MVIHPRLNFIYIGIKGYHPHELPSFHSSRNVCTAPVFQLQGGGGQSVGFFFRLLQFQCLWCSRRDYGGMLQHKWWL
jgi:hypothetical protein